MSGSNFNQEVEIKLRVADVSTLHRRLKQLRARQILPRTYESNTLYDTPTRNLTRRGQLIRIRVERSNAKVRNSHPAQSTNAVLTYKSPLVSFRSSQTAPRARNDKARFKIRHEVEVIVSDGTQMDGILEGLGLHPTFRYEKFRTTYVLPRIPGLKVEFDETPVGHFLELEGTAAAIDRAAKLLGYARSDYMTDSYGALYIADCRRRGRKPSNMLFPPTKMLR